MDNSIPYSIISQNKAETIATLFTKGLIKTCKCKIVWSPDQDQTFWNESLCTGSVSIDIKMRLEFLHARSGRTSLLVSHEVRYVFISPSKGGIPAHLGDGRKGLKGASRTATPFNFREIKLTYQAGNRLKTESRINCRVVKLLTYTLRPLETAARK